MRTPVTYKIKDFFKSFKKKSSINISSQTHSKILYTAGEVICDCLIEDGDFKIGGRGGHFTIRMVAPRGTEKGTIDFKQTKELGFKVFNFNDHSDGLIGRIFWDREKCIFRDKHMWLFKASRHLKRQLAPIILTGSRQYPLYRMKKDHEV